MDAAYINEVRHKHQPQSVCASCSKWVCARCRTMWPCDVERAVRDCGATPVGIYGYARLADYLL